MSNENFEQELKELNIEDFLSAIFIVLGILSIYGDQIQKKYIRTKNYEYQKKADNIFDFVLIATFFLYIFFLYRNYKNYENAREDRKYIFKVRLLGSCFFIVGALCTIYFRLENKKYVGVPEL